MAKEQTDFTPTPLKSLNVQGPVQQCGSELLPKGSIIMWYGDTSDIPTNWALCDGEKHQNSNKDSVQVPDLRSRFIVGVGQGTGTDEAGNALSNYSFKEAKGMEQVKLTIDQMPKHNHSNSKTDRQGNHSHYVRVAWGGGDNRNCAASGDDDKLPAQSHKKATSNEGEHQHNLNITYDGNNEKHENKPPYFALYFLMKII